MGIIWGQIRNSLINKDFLILPGWHVRNVKQGCVRRLSVRSACAKAPRSRQPRMPMGPGLRRGGLAAAWEIEPGEIEPDATRAWWNW